MHLPERFVNGGIRFAAELDGERIARFRGAGLVHQFERPAFGVLVYLQGPALDNGAFVRENDVIHVGVDHCGLLRGDGNGSYRRRGMSSGGMRRSWLGCGDRSIRGGSGRGMSNERRLRATASRRLRGGLSGLFRNQPHLLIEPVRTEKDQARQTEEKEHADLARHLFWGVRGFVGSGTHGSSGCPGQRGTGSNPPSWNGWQRARRRIPIHVPRRGPWISMASRI